MSSTILFDIAIVMLAGLVFGRLAKHLRMPNVTGYLIAGLVLGPCVLNFIPADMVTNFSVVSDMALGFIAFSIGTEFKLSYFRRVGLAPIIIAVMESFGAVILVTLVSLLFVSPSLAILLGAIAAATAPAQTVMVINQYHAKGPLTSMLMRVVALDDAVALIAFGFAATIVKSMENKVEISIWSILYPFYEVFISFALGAFIAVVMAIFLKHFKKSSNRLCLLVGFIFIAIWFANFINESALLCCMALGGVLVNTCDDIEGLIKVSDAFTPPLFMLFFAMSGAGFDLGAVVSVGLIGVIYIVTRVLGKIAGAWLGGKIMKVDEKICRYLGPTLMPQAGVALGLILMAGTIVPQYAGEIQTIILCSTFVYSILGPSVSKAALVKAGEISLESVKS